MASGVKGPQSGPEEESRGGDRPPTDGRSMAAADRQGHRPGSSLNHGRELGNFKSVNRAEQSIHLGLCPKPRFGGNGSKRRVASSKPNLQEDVATIVH